MSDKPKTKTPEVWWCIKSFNILLPYTARTTRRQCVEDWVNSANPKAEFGSYNKAVKITVTEVQR